MAEVGGGNLDMAEEHVEAHDRGIGDMIDKVHDFVVGGDSSSPVSRPVAEEDKPKPTTLPPASAPPLPTPKPKVYRLLGRERPVHQVLGGGLPADVILWRDKKISGGVLGFITAIWILFELLNYHLLTLIAHVLILALAGLFLWSNAKTLIHKSPPKIPVVSISEDHAVYLALRLVHEINLPLAVLRNIALGRDLKKFFGAIAGLWIISIVASWVDFLTLFYILFVLLHTVPVLYEKYEDIVDPFAEKALAEANRNFTMIQAKVMERIPKGTVKDKKQ